MKTSVSDTEYMSISDSDSPSVDEDADNDELVDEHADNDELVDEDADNDELVDEHADNDELVDEDADDDDLVDELAGNDKLVGKKFPQSKKRPRVASSCPSSATVPASIRRRVIAAANSRCWLCSQHGKHIAHVIARSDRILFDEFRSTGLLHMSSLHSFENLLYLCHGCHGAFDEPIPAWTFLPTTLSSFLSAEVAFHAARTAAAAAGILLVRPAPDPHPPPLLYARYQIRRGHVFTQVFRKHPTRLWAGNPVAAIIRSASVLMGVQRLDPVRRCGIPDDVGETLQRLLWLYATPPPKVIRSLPAAIGASEDEQDDDSLGEEDDDSLGEEEDDDEDGEEGSGEDEPVREQKSAPAEERRTTRGGNSGIVGQQNYRKHPLTPPDSGRKITFCEEEEWVFGPTVTANRMVDWFCSTRNSG